MEKCKNGKFKGGFHQAKEFSSGGEHQVENDCDQVEVFA